MTTQTRRKCRQCGEAFARSEGLCGGCANDPLNNTGDGYSLAQLRKRKGVQPVQVAERLGMTPREYIRRIEDSFLDRSTFERVRRVIEDLAEGEGQ